MTHVSRAQVDWRTSRMMYDGKTLNLVGTGTIFLRKALLSIHEGVTKVDLTHLR